MRQAERQTDIPINLESAIRRIAADRSLRIGFNTRWDAMNCVVSWNKGKTIYRLNFQPTTHGATEVTLCEDHYRFLSKLISWFDQSIPYFSYLTPFFRKISCRVLKELNNGESVDFYIKAVEEYIDNTV